jgi:hypothetical protein
LLPVGENPIKTAEANFVTPIPDLPHIYIRENGTVEPENAPVSQTGNMYTLERDLINESIIDVQKDNIVINGAGNLIKGMAPSGIRVSFRTNVNLGEF